MKILSVIIFAIVAFVIYYIFKNLQFVLQAVNLYKKIIKRQDSIISLLLDIRDNTKNYHHKESSIGTIENNSTSITQDSLKKCSKCNLEIPVYYKRCPKCGNKFE